MGCSTLRKLTLQHFCLLFERTTCDPPLQMTLRTSINDFLCNKRMTASTFGLPYTNDISCSTRVSFSQSLSTLRCVNILQTSVQIRFESIPCGIISHGACDIGRMVFTSS